MKARFIGIIAALVVFGAVAPAAKADDKADINALYVKLVSHMKKKDVKGIMAMGTSDFQMKQDGQTLDAAQASQQMSVQFQTMNVDSVSMKVSSFKVTGKKAVVNTNYAMKLSMQEPQGGPKHILADAGTTRDVLVKSAGGWKFRMTETVAHKTLMDGKPFNPMAPPGGGPGGGPTPPKKKK